MSLSRDDLRAAVAAGMISEAQAASVLALADQRRGVRENMDGLDEPFELFKGFNEIFIVVGLGVLWTGWMGLTGLWAVTELAAPRTSFGVFAAISMATSVALAVYFTLKRRMIAPSIALTLMFAAAALQLGASIGWQLGLTFQERAVCMAGFATLALGVWYWGFRIPFAMALVALGVFATAFAALVLRGAAWPTPQELFLLTGDGPFAILTVLLGLAGLAVALSFDMSDPHRVTRRSATGFWLHVLAAPAIVNTVALTLFTNGATGAQILLIAFLGAMALFAIVIDRRSFLVAGVGYVVAVSFTILEDSALWAIFALGLGMVLLGAFWERIRTTLMDLLPAFPGKTRLPPWAPRALT